MKNEIATNLRCQTFFSFIGSRAESRRATRTAEKRLDGRVESESESDDRCEPGDQSGCDSDDAFGDVVDDGELRQAQAPPGEPDYLSVVT
jgi:hypothetical protein